MDLFNNVKQMKTEIYPPDLMNSEMEINGDCKNEVHVKNESFDLTINIKSEIDELVDIKDASTKEASEHEEITYICPYNFEVCKFKSTNKIEFMEHLVDGVHETFYKNKKMTQNSVQSFVCKECDKSFKLKTTLHNHMFVHKGKTFPCDICGKSFSRATILKSHKRIHTGERPYQCDECDETFRLSDSLKMHKGKHSGKRDYMCEICSKTFYSSINLRNHTRHNHEKLVTNTKHECIECGNSFKSQSTLREHNKRKHQNYEKKFSCEHCGKPFINNSGLKEHIKIHTGDKPYVCQTCSKSFSNRSGLKVHQLNHSGELPFKCSECSHECKVLVQLKNHMVKIHGIEYTPSTTSPTIIK